MRELVIVNLVFVVATWIALFTHKELDATYFIGVFVGILTCMLPPLISYCIEVYENK